MTAARPYNHVFILFENDVGVVVKVEHRDCGELGGDTARLGHGQLIHQVHKGLHNGVVGGVHVRVERKRALSVAVVGAVALRGDDPVLWKSQHTGTVIK